MAKKFYELLREISHAKELTQGDCAERMGVKLSTWSHWYHGRDLPTYDQLYLIITKVYDLKDNHDVQAQLVKSLHETWNAEDCARERQLLKKLTDPSTQKLDTGTDAGNAGADIVRALPQPNYWYFSFSVNTSKHSRILAMTTQTDHLSNFDLYKSRVEASKLCSVLMIDIVYPSEIVIIAWTKIDHKQFMEYEYNSHYGQRMD